MGPLDKGYPMGRLDHVYNPKYVKSTIVVLNETKKWEVQRKNIHEIVVPFSVALRERNVVVIEPNIIPMSPRGGGRSFKK